MISRISGILSLGLLAASVPVVGFAEAKLPLHVKLIPEQIIHSFEDLSVAELTSSLDSRDLECTGQIKCKFERGSIAVYCHEYVSKQCIAVCPAEDDKAPGENGKTYGDIFGDFEGKEGDCKWE